jgi:hypothetical protein
MISLTKVICLALCSVSVDAHLKIPKNVDPDAFKFVPTKKNPEQCALLHRAFRVTSPANDSVLNDASESKTSLKQRLAKRENEKPVEFVIDTCPKEDPTFCENVSESMKRVLAYFKKYIEFPVGLRYNRLSFTNVMFAELFFCTF